MSVTCPQGHESDDADYCDTCGARIGAMPIAETNDEPTPTPAAAASPDPEPAPPTMPCPKCGTMRLGDDQFCEDCGFDFLDPDAAVAAADDGARVATAPIDDERPTWRVFVTADRDQYDRNAPDDIDFPAELEARIVVLDRDCVRIGRRSEGRGTHPEIDLAGPPMDTGVSRVHAVLNRQGNGSYALVDMGSANGTTVNDDGAPLPEGESRPLRHGDEIHVGAWTTITILRDPEPD